MVSLTFSIVTPFLADNIDTSLACLLPIRGAVIIGDAIWLMYLSPNSRSHNVSATTETGPKVGPRRHYRSVLRRSPVGIVRGES